MRAALLAIPVAHRLARVHLRLARRDCKRRVIIRRGLLSIERTGTKLHLSRALSDVLLAALLVSVRVARHVAAGRPPRPQAGVDERVIL